MTPTLTDAQATILKVLWEGGRVETYPTDAGATALVVEENGGWERVFYADVVTLYRDGLLHHIADEGVSVYTLTLARADALAAWEAKQEVGA